MPTHPGPPGPQSIRWGWLWLLPLALTATFIAAAHLVGLVLSGALQVVVGGGILSSGELSRFLQPLPGTAVVWGGLLLALLRPHTPLGPVVTLLGGIAVAVQTSDAAYVEVLWATLLLGLPALLRPG